jgi:hypothetical protein
VNFGFFLYIDSLCLIIRKGRKVQTFTEKERQRVKNIFKDLVAAEGSQVQLAHSLRLSKSAICQLLHGIFLPSARLCVIIERKYGIKKEALRPDIFN